MDTSPADIGRLLKARREALGYSLQSVAENTRIRKVYLESLENNRFAELPGRAYVTGFIRVYARHLGLDSNEVLALLDEAPVAEMKPVKLAEPGSKVLSSGSAPAKTGWRAFLYGFVAVLLAGAAIYYLPALWTDTEPPTQAEKPAVVQGEAPVKPEPVVPEAPVPGPVAEQVIAPAPSVAEPAAETPVPVADVQPLPTIPVDGATLRMLALTESSLIITVDSKKPHRYPLHDGLDLVWPIMQQVSVEMNDADIARFWLDGQELNIAGQTAFELLPAE